MQHDFTRFLNIRSAIDPSFIPGTSNIAFLCDTSGSYQVWNLSLAQEASHQFPNQLTFLPGKVWEVHATPAGSLLAVSDAGGNENQQLYLIEIEKSDEDQADLHHSIRRLTHNDAAIHRFGAWNSAGTEIIYTSNERNRIDFDLRWMNVQSGESWILAEAAGNRTIVAWSSDGHYVLSVDELSSMHMELFVLDLTTGKERQITAKHAPAVYPVLRWTQSGLYAITDRTDDLGAFCKIDPQTGELQELLRAAALTATGEFEHLLIASDEKSAVVSLNEDGFHRLFWLNLETFERKEIALPGIGVLGAVRFDSNNQRLVFNWQSAVHNSNLWVVELESNKLRQITFFDRAGIAPAHFKSPELIRFATFDGLQIPAWYFTPPSPAPADGYPCILYVHGGPASQLRPEFDVRFQYFINCGYAILATNVRGSTGYGRHYAELDEVEKRMDSVSDLQFAVKWLHGRSEINPQRIGIYGRSYGGFMVLAAITEYPELFRAAVDVVGISNWVTFLEKTAPWRRAHREVEYGSLAQHRDLLERISPIHKIERVRCPLHVQAGDNDPRVPLYESEQLVERVRANQGVVEFVHYADEGHLFSKLANRIDSFTKMADFLERYL